MPYPHRGFLPVIYEGTADHCFTGKEDDVEVGLIYFGKRFYAPLLQRWISPDPLAVHAPGEADLNLYAYVHGKVLVAVDPVGLQEAGASPNPNPPIQYHDKAPSFAPNAAIIVQSKTAAKANVPPAPVNSIDEALALARQYKDGVVHVYGNNFNRSHLGSWGDAFERASQHVLGLLGVANMEGAPDVEGSDPNASPDGVPGGMGSKMFGSKAGQAVFGVLLVLDLADGGISDAVEQLGRRVLKGPVFDAVKKVYPDLFKFAKQSPAKALGYGVDDPPVRVSGPWSINDMKQGLLGHPPKGLNSPDLHHADQMPGSGVHEAAPPQWHRGCCDLHPNPRNQGVTPTMREQDRQLHWWYRAREQGADDVLPDWIYDD